MTRTASSKKTKVYKSRMALDPLIKGMKSAYRSKSHDAINIGNITHNWVEEAINWKLEGGEIPKMPKQEEAVNSIEAFKDWVSQNVVEWKSSEEKLFNRKYRYAGTVDARAIINGEYCVIDWKTSKAVYPEYHHTGCGLCKGGGRHSWNSSGCYLHSQMRQSDRKV